MSEIRKTVPSFPSNPEGPEVNPESNEPIDAASLAAHYEQDDVDVRALVRFGIGIGVASVVAMVVLWLVMRAWTGQPLPFTPQVEPAAVDAPVAPGPGLDAAPEMTLEMIRARDAIRLETYGWVDAENGVVHIPIEEAMRQMVEAGVPARDAPVPEFGLGDAFRMDSTGGTLPVGTQADDAVTDEAAIESDPAEADSAEEGEEDADE